MTISLIWGWEDITVQLKRTPMHIHFACVCVLEQTHAFYNELWVLAFDSFKKIVEIDGKEKLGGNLRQQELFKQE